jgi:hypothetical protein
VATLQRVLIHLLAETERHAGHADVVRELIDGAVGRQSEDGKLAPGGEASWEAYRDRVERVAQEAGR